MKRMLLKRITLIVVLYIVELLKSCSISQPTTYNSLWKYCYSYEFILRYMHLRGDCRYLKNVDPLILSCTMQLPCKHER